jgi:hypothetical protein
MRTLTAFVAAAALIGSVSISTAQYSQSQNAPTGAANPATSTMNKGSMGQKVTGKSKFCLQASSGAMNCRFASMEACQKAAKGAQCMPNPKMGTTGSR